MQERERAPTVLVVEDEALIRLFIRGALEDGGYAAAEAGSADEALDLLQNDSYAAVVADVEMPGALNGPGLSKASGQISGSFLLRGRRPHHPKNSAACTLHCEAV